MTKKIAVVMAVVIGAVILYGSWRKVFMVSEQRRSISIPVKSPVRIPDPQHLHDAMDAFVVNQLHRSLFKNDSSLQIQPDLVERYEPLRGGTLYRLILKQYTFSDGRKLKSEYVVNTFRRMFSGKGEMALDLNYIQGAKKLIHGEIVPPDEFGIKAISDNIVEFHLEHPHPLFLIHLAAVDCAILPVSADINEKFDPAIGLGDYEVTSRDGLPENLTLKLRKASKGTVAGAPTDVVVKHKENSQAYNDAISGESDSLDGYSISEGDYTKINDAGFTATVSANTNIVFLYLNPKTISLQKRAILASKVATQFSNPPAPFSRAYGMVPNILGGSILALPSEIYKNSNDSITGNTFTIGIIKTEPVVMRNFETIRKILAESGIELRPVELTMPEFVKEIKERKLDLLIQGKFLDYPDGMALLAYFKSHSNIQNDYGINDQEINATIKAAELELNIEAREKLYAKIQIEILKKYTVVPLVFGSQNMGFWRKSITVPPHPLGFHSLRLSDLRIE